MARIILAILLLMIIGCEELTSISSTECESPCYSGPKNTYNVGECSAGIPMCRYNNEFVECVNQSLPSTEMCNGLDDDCDGRIDNSVYDLEIGDGCGSSIGECETGSWQCYKGRLTCYAEVPPQIETCNNKDDDCNGVVDDVGFSDYCFSGEPETLAFPPCHAGVLVCQSGAFSCLHEVVSSAEICDGIDNDCDGRIDEELSKKKYEVVFAVDRSCSMLPDSFNSAKQAMLNTVSEFENEIEVKFAVIVFPVNDANPVPLLITDFTRGSDALSKIRALRGESGSGLEPSYDVIQAVSDNTLGLSFSNEAIHYLIMWTDEAGQTFQTPLVHEPRAVEIIQDSSLIFIAFVPLSYGESFDDIASVSGGAIHPLTDANTMSRLIIGNLDLGCKE